MAATVVDRGFVKAWSTQRIANRFPSWSRARLEDDSIFQMILNPGAAIIDDIYSGLIRVKYDYFLSTTSQVEQPFWHILQLPGTFAFQYEEHEGGRLTFQEPTVAAEIDSTAITPTLLDPNRTWAVERDTTIPTRLEATRVSTSTSSILIPPTLLENLASATIAGDSLDGIGTIYIHIDEGEIFGARDERNHFTPPRVFIKGIMRGYRYSSTESVAIPTNGIWKSRRDWKSISEIWVEGISGNNATIKVDMGFQREQVVDQYALITTVAAEFAKTLTLTDAQTPPVIAAPPGP